jgi:type IV pilus assembly protein PilY1
MTMAKKVVIASLVALIFGVTFSPHGLALPPDVLDDLTVGDEDTPISGNVLDNDSPDSGGNTLVIISNGTPSDGALTSFNMFTGEFTFVPDAEFSGVVSFDYTVRELDSDCFPVVMDPDCDQTAVSTVFVQPVADLPTFNAGSSSGAEDTTIGLGLSIVEIDTDGSETSAVRLVGIPPGSAVSGGALQPDDSWVLLPGQVAGASLTPPPDFNGPISVSYTVATQDEAQDPGGNPFTVQDTAGGLFTVNVNSVNDDPVFVGPVPSISIDEDTSGSVELAGLVTDVDISTNGDFLSYTITGGAVQPFGTASLAGSQLTFVAAADQFGSGTVTVQVTDNFGGAPVDINIPVNVNAVNDDPIATGLTPTLQTDEDVDGVIDLDGIATDADIPTGDSLSYSVVSVSNAAVASASMIGSQLNVFVAQDQNGPGFVRVRIVDDANTAVTPLEIDIPVEVLAVNDDPFLDGAIPVLSTNEDSGASVDLTGVVNDVDILTNSDSVSYSILSVNNSAVDNAIIVGADLSITVMPDAWEVGGSISIRAADDNGGVPVDFDVPVDIAAINDAPVLVGSVSAVDVMEDDPPFDVDFGGVFADVDIATGDNLTLTATFDGGAAIFDSIVMTGEILTLTFTENANGVASVLVEASDTAGETVQITLPVQVQSVNDAPVVVGGLGNRNIDEDDPPEVIGLASAFDDVDIVTNADVLTYEVFSNSNPGIFSDVAVSGDTLTLTLLADANGTADIAIIARDLAGATSAPVVFTVTVNGVDDFPAAADDILSAIAEDSASMRIDVLANDYLGDVPTIISSVVDVGSHNVVDVNGDTVTTPQGSVTIDGTEIVFEPAPNFWGAANFQYAIQDSNGDEDTATVTFYVDPVNDPPVAKQNHAYEVLEGTTLTVETFEGLLVGAYDIDPSKVDDDGNPVPLVDSLGNPLPPNTLSVVFETAPPAAAGVLLTTASDGSFTFQPAVGFVGVTSFKYSVFDNALKSEEGTVSIEVIALPPVGAAPNPGEVAVLFNLANTPLEQSASVEPNVLVTMDDSGSMDWHITVDSTDDNGRFVISNASIANSNTRQTIYTYLFSLNVNSYSATNGNGRVLPSQESLPAGNDYNVWQARSAAFNGIYYNPTVTYEPWTGLDNANQDFADADPTAVRLDPRSASNTYDITTVKSYLADNVPNWSSGGGRTDITVNNFYIPRYYTPTGTRIEIRDNGSTYAGGPERSDCADETACTYDEEIQNFANWFQYYRSRELVAKAAIGNVVAELQDIRVGYETINRRSNEPIAEMNEYYWEGEKKELLDTIYSVDSSGSTPLRRALNDSGRILGCTHGSRGCPALPAPEGICQQNFTLLFSDGYWNGSAPISGNFDQDGPGVFDGGKYADTHSNTLADVAMFYYENDLLPAVDNGVPLSTADIDGVPAGTFTSSSELIHQHMKTFTIAFGVEPDIVPETAESALATDTFNWPSPGSAPNAKIDDMLHAAINGRGRFLNAGDPQALQTSVGTAFREFTQAASSSSAAAFNSTSLREGTLLYRGFYDLRSRTGELTASTVSTDGIIAGTPTWTAAELLDADNPSGLLPSERVIISFDPDRGGSDPEGIAFQYTALNADQQATLSSNQVDYLRGVRTFEEPSGSLRQRLDDEGLLGDIVNSSPVFVGEARAINRDQRPFPTDDLYSEFASNVSDRRKIVYVGANDGMLHGFDAITGLEVMAYVPNMIMDSTLPYSNKLNSYTSPFYLHDYFVDLSPRLNDVYMRPDTSATKQWMTTLVGGLGAGGKGFFALNVTNPDTQFADEATAKNSVLWEFTDEDDTYPEDLAGDPLGGAVGAILDPLNNPVKDMGYSLSLPVITMSNVTDTDTEKEWVAIFGNGTNSTSGIATLFVLFMDRGLDGWQSGDFTKISTGYGVPLPGEQLEGYPNALGSPTAIDKDLNGTVDLVYAGDRLGNLYRFDVSDSDPDNWEATRLFSATYDDGGVDVIQPILSKPLVVKHPEQDGFLITFGTGSFITEEDGSNTEIQSIYTIWDSLVSSPPTAAANSKATRLVEQTLTNVVDDSVTPAQTRRILSNNAVAYTPETGTPGVYGWYIDLDMPRATNTLSGVANTDISGQAPPDPQFPGEKAIRRFIFRDGAILTTTVLPATNATSCFGSRPGALLIFDALTGGDPGEPVVDFNVDGYVNENDLLDVGGQDYTAGLVFDQSQLDGQLVDLSTLGGEGATDFLFICGGNECISRRIRDLNDGKTGRLSWTELQRN